MERNELRMALRTLSFLDDHVDDPIGLLQLRARPTRRLLVWQPEALEWVFRHDRQLRHVPSRSLEPLLGKHSLLWTDGARHAAYRRTLAPLLMGAALHRYREVVADTVHRALDASPPGSRLRVAAWTRAVALRVIGRIVLDRADDEVLRPFTDWIHRALGWRPRTVAYRYLAGGLPRSRPELDAALLRAARAAVAAPHPTLGGTLASGTSAVGERDDAELRDQVVSLLFAGHETTGSAAAWALYWVHRDERLRQRLVAELDDAGADGFDAGAVPLLQAVVRETLRLCPPAPVAGNRVLPEPAELLGNRLAAGTVLTPSIYLAQHSPHRFARPREFDPGRFPDGRGQPEGYLPFGGGTRHCLGSELAMMEIRMILAAVLRRRRLRGGNPGAAVARWRGHAMAPSAGLRMAVLG